MEKKKKTGTKEFHRGLELSHHRDMWRQKKLWGQRSCPLCLVSRRPVTAWRTDPRDMDWRTVCCDTVTPNSSPGDYPGFKLPLPVKRRQSQLVKAPKIINTRSTVFSRVVLIWTVHSSLCHSVRGKKRRSRRQKFPTSWGRHTAYQNMKSLDDTYKQVWVSADCAFDRPIPIVSSPGLLGK